jgi:tRNA threonylcarbamoyladenosine biosynthesis protein TsaE
LPEATIYHFDLYRLLDPEELELMGFRDYFHPQALALVEWPVRGEPLLPSPDWIIALDVAETNPGRVARLTAMSAVANDIYTRAFA